MRQVSPTGARHLPIQEVAEVERNEGQADQASEATENAAGAEEVSQEETTLSAEEALAELKKVRREAAKYRNEYQKLKSEADKQAEAKRQADLSAEERAAEAERKANEAIAAAEERVKNAERRSLLAGKVTNPDRVLKLMDDPSDFFDEKGVLDEKALAKEFPEYMPQRSNATGGSSHENRPLGRLAASIDDQIRKQARGG